MSEESIKCDPMKPNFLSDFHRYVCSVLNREDLKFGYDMRGEVVIIQSGHFCLPVSNQEKKHLKNAIKDSVFREWRYTFM